MKIEKIVKLKSGKYKLYLDNNDVIITFDEIILKYNLLFSKEIDEELISKIINENNYYELLNSCIKNISKRLRSEKEIPYRYKLEELNHHFKLENDGKYYRISQVYRIVIDRKTNKEIKKELILDNHSEVMYDYNLIPTDEIKNEA